MPTGCCRTAAADSPASRQLGQKSEKSPTTAVCVLFGPIHPVPTPAGGWDTTNKGGIGLSRRLLLVLCAGALGAAGLFTSGAARAATAASGTPAGGACQLAGTANFTPGLTANSAPFNYGFTGNLSGCQSNNGSPTSGTVSAGSPITVGGVTYQEPAATGTGSCSSSNTQGISVTQWAGGTYTVVSYTTTGAAAAVQLSGTVVQSVVVNGPNGTTTTIATNEPSTPVGSSAVGELTFSTASPTDIANCNTAAGLSSAVINGFIEIGQQ